MKIGRSVSSAVAAHAALTTGIHGVGASPVCSETEAAALVAATNPVKVHKTADKTLNNEATLENDDHLLMLVGANEVWLIDIYLLYMGNTTAAFNFGLSYPIGCSIHWSIAGAGEDPQANCWGYQTAAHNGRLLYETETVEFGTASTDETGKHLILLVANGANAGNVNLQWAQKTATVGNSTVKANSCIIAHQLA